MKISSCLPESAAHFGEFFCIVYDFQTLIAGALAIISAVLAGMPVWRQIRDSNLQTKISLRQSLYTIMDSQKKVLDRLNSSLDDRIRDASILLFGPDGEEVNPDVHGIFYLDGRFRGAIEWYLNEKENTESSFTLERRKEFISAYEILCETLHNAHWADHNEQFDVDQSFSDEKWNEILAECAQAKLDLHQKLEAFEGELHRLRQAHADWIDSIRSKLARLNAEISSAR